MPQLNAIGIVSSDLVRSRAFYGLLGIEIAWGQRYAQLCDPDGVPVDLYATL